MFGVVGFCEHGNEPGVLLKMGMSTVAERYLPSQPYSWHDLLVYFLPTQLVTNVLVSGERR